MNCKSKLWRITLDTNPEDCNYHCIMCEEHSEYSTFREDFLGGRSGRRVMPVAWVENLMSEAAMLGVTDVIPSTMGEPLLYSGVDEFFASAKRHGLKVNLTTNGSFPRKPIDEWATQIIPITRDIKVSINGACKETSEHIMRGSNFDTQIKNIQHLVSARDQEYYKSGWYCSVTLQLTFMQCNTGELADIVQLAGELMVDRIKGHHLWCHFPEIEHLSMKANLDSIRRWNQYVNTAYSKLAENPYTLPNGKRLQLENVTPLTEASNGKVDDDSECPFLGRELWVSATGRISPCCCPDAMRRTLGDFGEYPVVSLQDVLQSGAYLKLLANYKSMDVCKNCNMRRSV